MWLERGCECSAYKTAPTIQHKAFAAHWGSESALKFDQLTKNVAQWVINKLKSSGAKLLIVVILIQFIINRSQRSQKPLFENDWCVANRIEQLKLTKKWLRITSIKWLLSLRKFIKRV